jgi:hypothetical protein
VFNMLNPMDSASSPQVWYTNSSKSRSYHLRSWRSSLWRLKLRDFSADFLGRDSIRDAPPANDDVRGSQLIL